MEIGAQVLFRPSAASMAREIGTVTAIDGDAVTIEWGGAVYERNLLTDFVRVVL